MGEVVVPIVAAVEDGKILRYVKIQPLVRWEGPFAEVQAV